MTATEKVAYLRGLSEGLGVDDTSKEGRVIKAIIDVLDDLAISVTDMEDDIAELGDQVEAVDEDLEALYPADIRLESASVAGGTVTVTLSPVGNRLTDISFTLAGACLARTCFELSSASTVIIQSGDRRLALDRDSLIFQDTAASLETTAP